jgi:hypothetical protein
MTNGREFSKPAQYEIRVKGHLDPRWSEWFDGFELAQPTDDETTLTGLVVDQPALHGLLTKVRDLGLLLLSVIRVEEEAH